MYCFKEVNSPTVKESLSLGSCVEDKSISISTDHSRLSFIDLLFPATLSEFMQMRDRCITRINDPGSCLVVN